LYSTEACHLCEQAKILVYSVIDGGDVVLREIDIAGNDDLMARYALSIPVLKNAQTNLECCWPFDAAQVAQLIAE
jgi:hypothetical protein